jgi:hypothetical protein
MPRVPSTNEILEQIESIQRLPQQVREAAVEGGPAAAAAAADLTQAKVNDVLLLLRQMLQVTELHRELKEGNA